VPARALAVVSSLFRYWLRTGYLIANPAADLSGGGAARAAWTPKRIMPAGVIALCDTVIAGTSPAGLAPPVWARRCAIWSLYRYGGVRLAELVWSESLGLPRLDVDAGGNWTLHVLGKGNKLRAIPLPAVCLPPLRAYRLSRGLTPEPGAFERLPPIHSEKRDALGASGLYDEVKAVFHAAQDHVTPGDGVTLALLRVTSTHCCGTATRTRWWSTTRCRCRSPGNCSATRRCRRPRPMRRAISRRLGPLLREVLQRDSPLGLAGARLDRGAVSGPHARFFRTDGPQRSGSA
jgi:hypothetical protein